VVWGSGLSPLIVNEIGKMLERLKKTGLAIILVEQNMTLATAIASYSCVVETL